MKKDALVERIKYEEKAKTQKCGCIGCNNQATHTWSGHPTCDECGLPNRQKRDIPRVLGGQ